MPLRAFLAASLLFAPAFLARAGAPPPPADDGVPPAPLPDFGDPEPSGRRPAPQPRVPSDPAAPRVPAARLGAARAASAREAALRRLRFLRGGSRDGSFPVYDSVLRRTWRLKLESLDAEPFAVAEGRVVARGRFAAKSGERLVLDFPLRPAGKSWEAEDPRIWSVADRLRYYYDLDGRVVELSPRSEPPAWLKLFPWLKKPEAR